MYLRGGAFSRADGDLLPKFRPLVCLVVEGDWILPFFFDGFSRLGDLLIGLGIFEG